MRRLSVKVQKQLRKYLEIRYQNTVKYKLKERVAKLEIQINEYQAKRRSEIENKDEKDQILQEIEEIDKLKIAIEIKLEGKLSRKGKAKLSRQLNKMKKQVTKIQYQIQKARQKQSTELMKKLIRDKKLLIKELRSTIKIAGSIRSQESREKIKELQE